MGQKRKRDDKAGRPSQDRQAHCGLLCFPCTAGHSNCACLAHRRPNPATPRPALPEHNGATAARAAVIAEMMSGRSHTRGQYPRKADGIGAARLASPLARGGRARWGLSWWHDARDGVARTAKAGLRRELGAAGLRSEAKVSLAGLRRRRSRGREPPCRRLCSAARARRAGIRDLPFTRRGAWCCRGFRVFVGGPYHARGGRESEARRLGEG
jgi:hypothetical protein